MATTQTQTRDKENIDVKQVLKALRMMSRGEFGYRLPLDQTGLNGELAQAFNNAVELQERLKNELDRIATVVGKEGKISQRATLGDATGGWSDSINSVNALVADLVRPTSEVARVIGAVAKGDLSQTMSL